MSHLPEAGNVLPLSPEDSKLAGHLVIRYLGVVRRLEDIYGNDSDYRVIESVDHELGKPGASGFITKLGKDNMPEFALSVFHALAPESDSFKRGSGELASMMGAAQSIPRGALTDANPATKSTIWGYRLIDSSVVPAKRITQLHFVVLHLIERTAFGVIKPANEKENWEKDDLLNSMTDVIIYDYLKYGRNVDLFDVWHRSKADGGLGWISDNRLRAFQRNLAINER